MFCGFFFKQKTAYEMRISDWSSDVCSSDLHACIEITGLFVRLQRQRLRPPLPDQVRRRRKRHADRIAQQYLQPGRLPFLQVQPYRSEERRVGKECVSNV